MKVILLAADSENSNCNPTAKKPRCLTQFVGAVTLLERQIRVLCLSGFKREDITVVIGAKGVWENSEVQEFVRKFNCRICINTVNTESNSGYSLKIALNDLAQEDCLVISGDVNFDVRHIESLLVNRKQSIALTRKAFSVGEKGVYLQIEGAHIQDVGDKVRNENFPWFLFCGMVYLTSDLVSLFKQSQIDMQNLSYIEVIHKISSPGTLKSIDYANPLNGTQAVNSAAKDLTGGSYAYLKKRYLVRKSASGEGLKKLQDEIDWLLKLPNGVKDYFPVVVDYKRDDNDIWFDMPWYDLNNLRKNILTGTFDTGDAMKYLTTILDFMFSKIYPNILGEARPNWVQEKHFDRVTTRLSQCYEKSPIFHPILNADFVIINGEKYRNLPFYIAKISNCDNIKSFFKPTELRMIHGDLHFQNMLIDETNLEKSFILADPRGELEGSDIYYDLGKLWHSFNGKYDLIHTDQYTLQYELRHSNTVEVNMILGDSIIVEKYNRINQLVEEKISNFPLISKDPNWLLKAKFSEAMHFSSVMPFHIFNNSHEHRALVLYFVAIKLMNDLTNALEQLSSVYKFNLRDEQDALIASKGMISQKVEYK